METETETETEKARTGGEKAVEDRADQLILSYERIEAFLVNIPTLVTPLSGHFETVIPE